MARRAVAAVQGAACDEMCIRDRPSVAREIARIVGATKREEGYFEGGGYAVTDVYKRQVQIFKNIVVQSGKAHITDDKQYLVILLPIYHIGQYPRSCLLYTSRCV